MLASTSFQHIYFIKENFHQNLSLKFMKTITEQSGKHRDLEKKSIQELTSAINAEDQSVAYAIEKELPAINALIERLFQS